MTAFERGGQRVTDWWVEDACESYGGRPRVLRRWRLTKWGWDYEDVIAPTDAEVERALAANQAQA